MGEISYVSFIERENKISYIVRIKQYIDIIANRIRVFPELVDAYNNNRFFDDSEIVIVTKINIEDNEEFDYFENVFQIRKQYLSKNGLEDICKYSDWPNIKKKDEVSIHSSAAEYLTYIAAIGDDASSFEMHYQEENIWLTQK